MSAMLSWESYCSLHSVITDETTFNKYEALAEKQCALVIGQIRWEEIDSDTYGYAVLQDCIGNVIDKLYEDETNNVGKGLASVSNDGYSETYAVKSGAELRTDMRSSIREWLSGTGLVRSY